MNVLSLFDGMSCGRVALERCGFEIDKYYAAEIDKYAINVAANNYPDTIHIGDVTKVFAKDLEPIDFLIGGSPCQGFSFAGKQLNFEDPRSKLFFEFVRLLKECKPKYFFLENVVMKKEYQDVISNYLGVEPIMLNSSLVSAQSRKRLYWTNIPGYTPPEDRGILLKDILEEQNLNAAVGAAIRNQMVSEEIQAQINIRREQKSNCVVGSYPNRLNLIKLFNVNPSGRGMNGQVYSPEGKSPTITTNKGEGTKILEAENIRKLTPIECERLQTLPDNYTAGVSNSQRYKMLGNGWTVDAVCEFFRHIPQDLDLF